MYDLQGFVENRRPHRRHEGRGGAARRAWRTVIHALHARTGRQTATGRSGAERSVGNRPESALRRPRAADRSGAQHVAAGAGRTRTGPKDLRPRESALRTRGRAGAEIRRGAGAVQRHDRDRLGRQGAVRPGGRRRLEGGESRRRGTGAAGRRRRIGGGELPERRDGLFARYGRNLDDHRRAGRAGGQRLSRGRHPRHERHVGDVQHQGDADAKDPNGQAPARLCARTRPRCRLPHHLHRSAGRFRHMGRDAHAGRIRHPYLRRQGRWAPKRGCAPA